MRIRVKAVILRVSPISLKNFSFIVEDSKITNFRSLTTSNFNLMLRLSNGPGFLDTETEDG